MPRHRGADAVMGAMRKAGVARIFTVSGNHVMSLFDAALDAGVELVHARHEAAAVHMADAWSRVSGEVGIALVTAGPGHANAVSALYTAQMAESAIVLLSGHAPGSELGMGSFQEMRQAEMALPVTKAAWTCEASEALAGHVARAIRLARSGRPGPVQVSLPSDALEGDSPAIEQGDRPAPESTVGRLEAVVAAEIMRRLRSATRPIILVGPQGLTRHGRGLMHELEVATGIPVIGMESPRGIADPSLGAFAEVLPRADLVLLAGKRLDFTLRFGRAPAFGAQCEFIQVDADQAELERSRRAVGSRLAMTATAALFPALQDICRMARGSHAPSSAWRDEVRAAVEFRPPTWDRATSAVEGRLHPVQALRPIQALLDSHPDSVLVSDGGEFGQWAQACLRSTRRVINGVAGSIGSALPYAIGARFATPAPVVAVLGDGTFGFHAAEIDTAVRHRQAFVAVVGNDARWNAEYQIQLRNYGPDRLVGCELLPTRYDQVCEAFGGYGENVTAASAMTDALARAHRSGRPACINVMIDGLAAPHVRR